MIESHNALNSTIDWYRDAFIDEDNSGNVHLGDNYLI